MGSVLLEIMAPELKEAEERAIEKGRQEGILKGRQEGILEGICGTVNVLRSLGISHTKIKEAVKKQYGLSDQEIERLL